MNPGDAVNVVGGTFAGSTGVVIEMKNPTLMRVALEDRTALIRVSDLELA